MLCCQAAVGNVADKDKVDRMAADVDMVAVAFAFGCDPGRTLRSFSSWDTSGAVSGLCPMQRTRYRAL